MCGRTATGASGGEVHGTLSRRSLGVLSAFSRCSLGALWLTFQRSGLTPAFLLDDSLRSPRMANGFPNALQKLPNVDIRIRHIRSAKRQIDLQILEIPASLQTLEREREREREGESLHGESRSGRWSLRTN